MSEAEKLRERLKALTGPDRDIDAELSVVEAPMMRNILPHWTRQQRDELIPRYTNDIHAAIGLAERLVPGVWWNIAKGRLTAAEPMYGAHLLFGPEEIIGEGEGPTAAIALILAALSVDPKPPLDTEKTGAVDIGGKS